MRYSRGGKGIHKVGYLTTGVSHFRRISCSYRSSRFAACSGEKRWKWTKRPFRRLIRDELDAKSVSDADDLRALISGIFSSFSDFSSGSPRRWERRWEKSSGIPARGGASRNDLETRRRSSFSRGASSEPIYLRSIISSRHLPRRRTRAFAVEDAMHPQRCISIAKPGIFDGRIVRAGSISAGRSARN
jgi:hypothetical protein